MGIEGIVLFSQLTPHRLDLKDVCAHAGVRAWGGSMCFRVRGVALCVCACVRALAWRVAVCVRVRCSINTFYMN